MPARLLAGDDGGFAVEGELDFDSVAGLWDESLRLFQKQSPSRIDLAGVKRSNSAGVALLVEWLREAKAKKQELCFINIPPQMMSIIEVADLNDLPSFDCRTAADCGSTD